MTTNKKQNVPCGSVKKRRERKLVPSFFCCSLCVRSILVLEITEFLKYFPKLLYCQCFVSCLIVLSNTASIARYTRVFMLYTSNWVIVQIYKSARESWLHWGWSSSSWCWLRKWIMEPAESPDHLSSCPNKPGAGAGARSGPVFTEEGGERRDLKTFHRMLFKRSVSNHGSKSNPRWENKLWYLTLKQRKGVFIEWLAWWVNSPAISSHSYAERSWLSLKWYAGSGIWNAPDWSRSRKLCLTWHRKSQ